LGWLAALAAMLAASAPAAVQPRRPIEDPEAAIVGELVVMARDRGPAWWRVQDADTTVYILGTPGGPMPPGIAWDRNVLERRMKGAHSVVMGAALTARLRDVPALLRARSMLKSRTPMEDGLAPPLRARFVAARERLGQPAERYSGWQPAVAGQLLVQDAYAGKGWILVEDVVRDLARKHRAPTRGAARYPQTLFLNAPVAALTPQIQRDCLEGALEDVDAGAARMRRSFEGWAVGDVETALTAPRSFDRCLLVLSGGANLWRIATRDNANDIAEALKTPGHAVAVVSLRRLLAEDGVIEQLEAKGLKVIGPAEPS
jgi:uncharacterized protein YbaP (TraB family)